MRRLTRTMLPLSRLRHPDGRRLGMTLIEVMLALAIFLIGSVSIVGLFVAASTLHADAANRRVASFIAEGMLSEVQSMRMRTVFAKTTLFSPFLDTDTDAYVDAAEPDASRQAASFGTYPMHPLFDLRDDPSDDPLDHDEGAVLIEGEDAGTPTEWAWYTGWDADGDPTTEDTLAFVLATGRWLWSSTGLSGAHADGRRVLSPRTWYYVLDADVAAYDPPSDGSTTPAVTLQLCCEQDPTDLPSPGYLVVDEEWMRYGTDSSVASTFNAGTHSGTLHVAADMRRHGQEDTAAGFHRAGTPLTIARECPTYPGFYYAVQFYPVNATGSEAHVIISVGYGSDQRFRVHTLRSIYTPKAL